MILVNAPQEGKAAPVKDDKYNERHFMSLTTLISFVADLQFFVLGLSEQGLHVFNPRNKCPT